ncbi:hypothetical protein T439DRAFT_314587 [Meredithblackwellia eburnea MCA 4105]
MAGIFWATPGQAAFDTLLEKTTSDLLPSSTPPDLVDTLQLADLIRSSAIPPATAVKSIQARITHQNPNVQLLALSVLDICIKNGGTPFLVQVGGKDFSTALETLARGKADGNRDVKDLVLKKLQDWAIAFQSKDTLRNVDLVRSYERLKNEGLPFPPKDPTATAAMVDSLSAPEWKDANYCTRCRTEFSTFNRKHHCRNCGLIFDQQCSSQSMPLEHFGVTEPVRVCDGCVKKLKEGKGAELARSTSLGANGSSSDTKLPQRSSTVSYSSRSDVKANGSSSRKSKEDEDLERAIAASLLDANPSASSGPAYQLRDPPPPAKQPGYNPSYTNNTESSAPTEEEDDPDLAAAIAASLRDMPPQHQQNLSYNPASTGGAAATYASLYPSSTSSYSYPAPAAAVTSSPYPSLPQPQSHALASYDLSPAESSTIYNFTSTLERPPPVLGSRERDLYEEARKAAPRLERGLEDAERRTEILVEMNDKLGEATRLFEGLLDRKVRDSRVKSTEYGQSPYSQPATSSYYQAPASYAAPPTTYAPYHQPQPLPHVLGSPSLPPQPVYNLAPAPPVPVAPQPQVQPQLQQQYHPPQPAHPQPAGYYKPSSFPAVPTGPLPSAFPAVPNANPAQLDYERERREREEAESKVGELIEL